MTTKIPKHPAKGWKGGFAQSNPDFAYPVPDITSINLTDNLANIPKLTRQQKVLWPQFSWETVPGDANSRCFQMFAPDISRLGYDDEGRTWSIICPQQGVTAPFFGSMNVEVTVTGQRGWVDEPHKSMYAEIIVVPKIWFSPGSLDKPLFKIMRAMFDLIGQPFPLSKQQSLRLNTYRSPYFDEPLPAGLDKRILPIRDGSNPRFESPAFATHMTEAWHHANLEVEIGGLQKTGHPMMDDFGELVMTAFNLASGNMLAKGNVLSWNVWFAAPEKVDQTEWADHAEKWRKSIDADHGSPGVPGTDPQYFDGSRFYPGEEIITELENAIKAFFHHHGDNFTSHALSELSGLLS